MRRFCSAMKKPCMANMVTGGKTPILPPAELQEIGYKLALYPVMLLSSAIAAMQAGARGAAAGLQRAAAAAGLVRRAAEGRRLPGLLGPRDALSRRRVVAARRLTCRAYCGLLYTTQGGIQCFAD